MLREAKKGGSIHKVVHRKQVTDFVGVGITFLISILTLAFSGLPTNAVIFILVLMFIVTILILEISRKLFLKSLQEAIADMTNNAEGGIKKVESVTNSQKDNINSTVLKLTNIKNIIQNLKAYLESMNECTGLMHKQTQESLEFSNAENLAVKANIDKMFMIRHKIQTIAELILELSEFIQSISSTIGVVKDIAEQTNLLALNAAVEAARAGEHGKGFAVVAGEIRKLADESKQATSKITSLIMDIRQTTNSTVMATEEGTKEIESGIGLAQSIDKNIEALISLMNEISGSTKGVIGSSSRIAGDIAKTNAFLEELNNILEQNYKVTEENFKNIEDLNSVAKSFRESV